MAVNTIPHIDLNEFDYVLPPERIASFPLQQRDSSRLLIRNPDGSIINDLFRNLNKYILSDSYLVLNNSRVIPARLLFSKQSGSAIELFCVSPAAPADYVLAMHATTGCIWQCMIGNRRRFKGSYLEMTIRSDGKETVLRAEKLKFEGELAVIRFTWDNASLNFGDILQKAGQTPLPPYIKRPAELSDRERYQTIYSSIEGSVAAPTAGLHFTGPVIEELRNNMVNMLDVTLHVGAGTFLPIKTTDIYKHNMHSEFLSVTRNCIEQLYKAKGPVIAVGTTVARTIETLYWLGIKIKSRQPASQTALKLDQWESYDMPQHIDLVVSLENLLNWMERKQLKEINAYTDLMIVPGYRFRILHALLTNYHLPKSTLLLLIAAFIGDAWKEVYTYALEKSFRFLSYGDSSLLFRHRE